METQEAQEQQRAEAAAALKQIADSRAVLAERLIPPWWYYPAFGILIGAMIAALALPWGPVTVIPACGLAASLLLPRAYRNATGFSITSIPLGRPLFWLIPQMLVIVGLFIAGVALRDAWGWVGPVLAGIVAVPVIIVGGRRYDAAVRADVRGRA